MSVENLDQQIASEEQRLRALRKKRETDLEIRRRGARIIEVENDFFVKALPKIFQARIHKMWLVNLEDLDKQIDDAAAEAKLAVQEEARRIWQGEFYEKDGKKTVKEYVKIDDVPALIKSVMGDSSTAPKPQLQKLDFGQFIKNLISACYKVDLWASQMKNLVRQQASKIIEEAPTLYKKMLDKMAEIPEFQNLILETSRQAKARVLDRLIKEVKGEPDTHQERTEALEKEKRPTAEEIFTKMKGYAR